MGPGPRWQDRGELCRKTRFSGMAPRMARRRKSLGTEPVKHDLKAARGDEARIEQLERARREVPRIGVGRLARLLLYLVDPAELLLAQIDFTADLDHVRRALTCQRMGQTADRFHVGRDIVTLLAVAAGDGAREAAALVGEAHRHTVDLRLHRVGEVVGSQRLGESRVKFAQFRLVVGVVERGHRQPVLHAGEALGAIVTDARGGSFGADRRGFRREPRLERGQLGLEAIVVKVGDLRARPPVIKLVVTRHLGAQFGDAWAGLIGRHACDSRAGGRLVQPALGRDLRSAPHGVPRTEASQAVICASPGRCCSAFSKARAASSRRPCRASTSPSWAKASACRGCNAIARRKLAAAASSFPSCMSRLPIRKWGCASRGFSSVARW